MHVFILSPPNSEENGNLIKLKTPYFNNPIFR